MTTKRNGVLFLGWAVMMVHALAVHAEWYIEAGPWYRGGMRASAEGGSYAGRLAVEPGRVGAPPVAVSGSVNDDGSASGLRQFDDGYVGPSGWPLFLNDGLTQYFGYERDAQYDPVAHSLSFTRRESREQRTRQTVTEVTLESAGWSSRATMDGVGLQGTLGYTFRREAALAWSWQAQAGWLGGVDASFRDQTAYRQAITRTTREYSLTQTESVRAVFDTLGNPAFPSAPYAMTDPNGVGPLIADTPSSVVVVDGAVEPGERVVARSQTALTSLVDLDSQADLFTLSLGPRLAWQWHERISLMVQGGVTLNLFDVQLVRSEVLRSGDGRTVAAWADRQDEQVWRWGAGALVGGQWQLGERLYLIGGAGYEWVERTTVSIGPDRIRYDLSGYRIDVAFGWRFP